MLANTEYEVINQVPFSYYPGPQNCRLFIINTMAEWDAFYSELMKQKLVMVDTETTGFSWFGKDRIVGMSLGWGLMRNFYIPFRHESSLTGGEVGPQIKLEDVLDDLKAFFAQEDVTIVGHNCLTAESLVHLSDGTKMTISQMVRDKHEGPVLTLNEKTGTIESKKVTGWIRSDLRPVEEFLKIGFRGKGYISCTREHEILTLQGRKRAYDLTVGDKVWNNAPSLKDMKSFLVGALLGDSSISLQKEAKAKTPHIIFGHCVEDLEYVEWKRSLSADLHPSEIKLARNERGFSKPDGILARFTLPSDSRLFDIYDLCTKDGKKVINSNWVQELDHKSLAIWYGDNGNLLSSKSAQITNILPAECRDALSSKLLDLGVSKHYYKDLDWTTASRLVVWLPWEKIAPWLPKCLSRKIPEEYHHLLGTGVWDLFDCTPRLEEVKEVTKLFEKQERAGRTPRGDSMHSFCIEVEDNSNFFINKGFCVSNCKFDLHFIGKETINVKNIIRDTRIQWALMDENAPGALKTISSGWRDLMGQWHPGLVSKDANDLETEVSEWRAKEASARRKYYSSLVMAAADEAEKDMAFQHMKRTEIKKHIQETLLKDHPYREAKKEDIHYGVTPLTLMAKYAALDVYLTWVLYHHTLPYIQSKAKLWELYLNEIELSEALFRSEEHGMVIRKSVLEDIGKTFDAQLVKLEAEIKEMLGDTEINLNSKKQLADALLILGIKLEKTTESSTEDNVNYAVDKEVLNGLANEHPVAKKLLELSELTKLKSTYVDGILEKVQLEGTDWIIHPTFNQNVSTGRMGCSNPSVQQIPGKTENGKLIRTVFGVPEGYVLLTADFSQIELRILAHASQDPLLLDAYAKDQDVHTRSMCEMFEYNYDEVFPILKDEVKSHPNYALWKFLRGCSKITNFGIVYGSGPDGLSTQIPRPKEYVWTPECGLTKAEMTKAWINRCKEFIDMYLYKYAGVKRFINKYSRQVYRTGEVEDSFGRIRHLPWHKASETVGVSHKWMESRAARQGVNFKIQGEAADMFKTCAVRVHKLFEGKKSKLVAYIHDELYMYIHKEEMDLLPLIKEAMEDFPQYSVPIIAELSWSATDWGSKMGLK